MFVRIKFMLRGCVVFILLIVAHHTVAGQEDDLIFAPINGLRGAYANYYRYYIKREVGSPTGADIVSDAVISLRRSNSYFTGFLINSYREDGQICLCTVKHAVAALTVGEIPDLEAHMNYLGSVEVPEWDFSNKAGSTISGSKSVFNPELVATSESDNEGDWAIFTLDPDEIPVDSFATVGYNFNSLNTWPPSKYHTIAHPYEMPQRASDSLEDVSIPSSPFVQFIPMAQRSRSGAMGPGASGAPIINYSLPFPALSGIFRGRLDTALFLPEADVVPFSNDWNKHLSGGIAYGNRFLATKINTPSLMKAIKTHCWKKSDSLAIETDNRYKKSVRFDNTEGVGEFQQSRTITSQSGLEAAADQSYGAYNVNSMLLKAATLTVNCLINNKVGKDKLYCLAREAVLEAGFSYLAVGAKQLSINTVVIESGLAGKPSAPQKDSVSEPEINIKIAQAPFNIYPNPSYDGTFHISFPVSAAGFRLEVMSTDGRLVHSLNSIAGVSPYKLIIPGLSRGIYVLSLYDKKNGKMLFNKQVVYQ